MSEEIKTLINDYREAEMVVIGIGSELHSNVIDENYKKTFLFFEEILDKKNYFIISTNKDNVLEECNFNRKRYVQPLLIEKSDESNENDEKGIEEKQWELYNKWLSATINKKLLIIELGENFNNPNVFRWPFENIAFINNKAKMYRVNGVFPQLPKEIKEKAYGINENAYKFVEILKEQIENENK